jgi:proline dehydrogenase
VTLDAVSKRFFHTLAASARLKQLASRYGMRRRTSFARRFIAGESLEEAIAAAKDLEKSGLRVTLDHLGESVTSPAAADAATREYIASLPAIVAAGITRNISLKLTQLGLELDAEAAISNLRRILTAARDAGFFIRIDMEQSAHVEATLNAWETLWNEGFKDVGVVLQASLHRSEADLKRVIAAGGRVRLVKGAYDEPPDVAYQDKADVDAAFVRMTQALLLEGNFPAIATHDAEMIDAAKQFASEHGISKDRFEFQMLYGIRRDMQMALKDQGYGMRVYVPFGREWFPYFMRRLGERPANVMFVVRSLLKDRGR